MYFFVILFSNAGYFIKKIRMHTEHVKQSLLLVYRVSVHHTGHFITFPNISILFLKLIKCCSIFQI